MDLKVNSINFSGKKEVLYALTKAAQKAKNYEYYNQPNIASRITTSTFFAEQNASMNAYLDMALRDEAFKKTIDEMKPSELYYLHVLLMPEQTQYSIVKPINKFKQAMSYILSTLGRAKADAEGATKDLYRKLEL